MRVSIIFLTLSNYIALPRGEPMLSRKNFVAVASSALCALPSLTGIASAQSPAPASGLTRKILSRIDGPAVGYETLLVDVGVGAGAVIPRHTHPGIESTYILEGNSSCRSRVSRRVYSSRETASRFRQASRMAVVRLVPRSCTFSSPMSWRRTSRSQSRRSYDAVTLRGTSNSASRKRASFASPSP